MGKVVLPIVVKEKGAKKAAKGLKGLKGAAKGLLK